MKKLLFTLLSIGLLFNGCKKKSSDEDKNVDVYAVGYEMNQQNIMVAKLWKNGVATALSDGKADAVAIEIALTGTDVYIVGYEMDKSSGNRKAKLWKNGVARDPFGVYNTNSISAHCITVSGSNLCILASQGAYRVPVFLLWQNGMINEVTHGSGSINNLAYVWKNGTRTDISRGNVSQGRGIAVSNDDVYTVGSQTFGDKYCATLWRNGVAERLSYDPLYNSMASSVVVSGNDIYVAGCLLDSNNYGGPIKVWKNGREISIANNFNANYLPFHIGLAVWGQDVYVAARDEGKAKIWKNGIPVNLTDGMFKADVYAVAVRAKQ